MLEHLTLRETTKHTDVDPTDPVDHEDPDPERIAATTGGAGFNLAHCVDTLCQNIVELAA